MIRLFDAVAAKDVDARDEAAYVIFSRAAR
jgi:hypothetical protein